MNPETLDLVARLCAHAGMIMEDAHDAALSIGTTAVHQQLLLLAHLEDSASRAARLFSAARALVGE